MPSAREFSDWSWRNYALCGSGTLAQYLLFERHVRAQLRRGDAVLLAFYENDFADNVGTGFVDWTRGEVVDGEVVVVPPPPPRLGKQIKRALKDPVNKSNVLVELVNHMPNSLTLTELDLDTSGNDHSNGRVRAVAERSSDVVFFDARAWLEACTPEGLVGYELVMDACHLQPGARLAMVSSQSHRGLA